jgi:hypothetical protein
MNRKIGRAAFAATTVAASLSLAGPALACENPAATSPHARPASATWAPPGVTRHAGDLRGLTAEQLKARVDRVIAARQAFLTRAGQWVAAGTTLGVSRKAMLERRIAAAQASLRSLKATVDGESSVAAIRADLQKAFRSWAEDGHTHHRDHDGRVPSTA